MILHAFEKSIYWLHETGLAYGTTRLDLILLFGTICLCSSLEHAASDRGPLINHRSNKCVDVPCTQAFWSDRAEISSKQLLDTVHLIGDLHTQEVDCVRFHPMQKMCTAMVVLEYEVQNSGELPRWIQEEQFLVNHEIRLRWVENVKNTVEKQDTA